MTTETARLEKLFEKFKFVNPIPEPARKMMLKSRARVLRATLKKVGAYSIWFSLLLFIIFRLRKIGLKFAVSFANAAAITATVLTTGAAAGGIYVIVKQYTAPDIPVIVEETVDSITEENNPLTELQDKKIEPAKEQVKAPVYEIILYSGKKYYGSIKSRGKAYILNTANGTISVPAKQIKMIKRVEK
ncbi:MAG: hypothetical protein V1874_15655 [Spirochaetota bacterium]